MHHETTTPEVHSQFFFPKIATYTWYFGVRNMGSLAGTSGQLPEITCQAPSDHFKDGRSVKSLVEDLYHKRVAVDADFLALDVVGAGEGFR